MLTHIWWSLPLTIGVYFLARAIYIKFKLPVLNPLLISIVIIIPLLIFTGTSYNHYFEGSRILNDLLQPAVVALAFPLYEQLHQIRAQWKSIQFYRRRGGNQCCMCDFRRDPRRDFRPYPVQTPAGYDQSLTRPGNGYSLSRSRYCPLRGRGLCGRRLQFTGINDLRDYYFSDGAVYLPGTAGIIRLT